MPGDAGSLWGWLGLDTKDYLSALKGANDATEQSGKQQEQSFNGIGESLSGIGTAVAGLGIGAAITEFGIDALETYEKVGKLHAGFVGLNGATEETEKLFNDISGMELKSNFDFEDVLGPAAKQMLTLGVNASDTTKYMQNIIDAAAGLKLPAENIPGIANAIGRMGQETDLSTKSMKALQSEGVPAWDILANAMGKKVPEAMELVKKGAISSQDAIAAITAGMADRWGGDAAKAVGTFRGAMNQLDQATEDVRATIGQSLKGLLDNVAAPAIGKFVELIQGLTEWFKELPGPVQNGIVAFGAMIAAVAAGAAMWASFTAVLGPIVGAIEVVVAALSWPVVAIAALLAALVAFGTWVYANWDPIVAVVSQAWQGIQDIWMGTWEAISGALKNTWNAITAVWHQYMDPLINAMTKIWDVVIDYFAAVWTGIAKALNAVWQSILDIANKVWGAITDAIKSFIDFASKIPGVSSVLGGLKNALNATGDVTNNLNDTFQDGVYRLSNLGVAWDLAKSQSQAAQKQTEANTKAEKENAAAHKDSTVTVVAHATATEKAKDAAKAEKDAKEQQKLALDKETQARKDAAQYTTIYFQSLEKAADAQEKKTLADAKEQAKLKDLQLEIINTTQDTDDFTLSTGDAAAVIAAMPAPVYTLAEALKNLGITSAATYDKMSKDSYAAYQAVVNAGGTKFEQDSAYLKYLQAEQAAARAHNTTLTKEQLDTLNTLQKQVGDKAPAITSAWGDMTKNVSTVITNFAQDMAKTLWDGDQSWGEKFTNLWGSLRDAVTSSFLEPVTKAFNDFIGGVLSKLLGGEGFGGIGDLVGGLASKIGGLFGLGGGDSGGVQGGDNLPLGLAGAGSGLTNLLSKIPGLGGLASSGGAASGLGSLAGMANPISLITGGISAVTGILDTLGIGVGKKGEIDRMNNIANDTRFLAWCYDTGRVYLNIWDIRNELMYAITPRLDDIRSAVQSIDGALQSAGSATGTIVIQISPQGLTTAEAARALGNQIAANLSTQLVAV